MYPVITRSWIKRQHSRKGGSKKRGIFETKPKEEEEEEYFGFVSFSPVYLLRRRKEEEEEEGSENVSERKITGENRGVHPSLVCSWP